ncbi:cation diffusion facilitator family transporter [Biostraticola tofi]|uniref:Cation diffusion facilitator family transporter n=2 Tax=Biostraticola tofi TaxID=466109 RepID=A0A4R3YXI8_9GAMM|nr:cation diffusion facilitator family transporter [Biostraticola tofi]
MVASGLLAAGKFIVGFFTGSIGLISEGIHSLTDFLATAITWMAVRVSDKPSDEDHHFGHGKIENMAALFEVLLLVAAAAWIGFEAIKRLWGEPHEIIAAPMVILVLMISIGVDFFRARALRRVAKATNSPALEADALHFISDMLASGVVLLGMVFVMLGFTQADAIAALMVAVGIFIAALKLGKNSYDTLTDAAPEGKRAEIAELVRNIPDVLAVENTRLRYAGATFFIEVTIAVCRSMSLEQISTLKLNINAALRQYDNHAQVTVIAWPRQKNDEDIATSINLIASRHDVAVHHLTLQRLASCTSVSLDLEVPAVLSVIQAHDVANLVENAIREELGGNIEIETHIEPRMHHWLASQDVSPDKLNVISQQLKRSVGEDNVLQDIHNVRVRETKQGYIINYHCRVPPFMSIIEAHDAVDSLERRLRGQQPFICRVVGHVEPFRALPLFKR